jgi:hypothetical protein
VPCHDLSPPQLAGLGMIPERRVNVLGPMFSGRVRALIAIASQEPPLDRSPAWSPEVLRREAELIAMYDDLLTALREMEAAAISDLRPMILREAVEAAYKNCEQSEREIIITQLLNAVHTRKAP